MTKLRLLAIVLTLTINLGVFAQQTAAYTSDLVDFQKALSLYNSKQYLAAQSMFDKIEDTATDEVVKSDCAYKIL